jgi:hypothetical protein
MSAIERPILIAQPPTNEDTNSPSKNRISQRVASIDGMRSFGYIESRELSSRDSAQPIRVRLCINTMPSGVARFP